MLTVEYLRQFKILNYAVFDFAASYLGVYLLAPLLTRLFRLFRLEIPTSTWLLFTLPLGILVHYLVGNLTPMTKDFLNPSGHYLLKLVIIIMLYLGIRKIKLLK